MTDHKLKCSVELTNEVRHAVHSTLKALRRVVCEKRTYEIADVEFLLAELHGYLVPDEDD